MGYEYDAIPDLLTAAQQLIADHSTNMRGRIQATECPPGSDTTIVYFSGGESITIQGQVSILEASKVLDIPLVTPKLR